MCELGTDGEIRAVVCVSTSSGCNDSHEAVCSDILPCYCSCSLVRHYTCCSSQGKFQGIAWAKRAQADIRRIAEVGRLHSQNLIVLLLPSMKSILLVLSGSVKVSRLQLVSLLEW